MIGLWVDGRFRRFDHEGKLRGALRNMDTLMYGPKNTFEGASADVSPGFLKMGK